MNPPAAGAVVLVMQRLHVGDLAGVLLETGGWEHLNLSAIAEQDERVQTGVNRGYDRLHPARLGHVELERLKRDLGSLTFSAQYQQSPAPPDGNMVKRVWFRDYDPHQFDRRSMTIVQSWDTALKGDPSSDYSVGTTWAKDDNNYYLLDLVRVRAAYPDLIKAVKNSLLEHSPDIIPIEDAGSGSSLIADLESQDISTTPVKARTDKESRLSRVAAMIENGNVNLPKVAHWRDDFLLEVLAFPHGKHDDQVDSMTQALIWMKDDKPTGEVLFRQILKSCSKVWAPPKCQLAPTFRPFRATCYFPKAVGPLYDGSQALCECRSLAASSFHGPVRMDNLSKSWLGSGSACPHSLEDLVLQHVVMEQRSEGMAKRQYHDRPANVVVHSSRVCARSRFCGISAGMLNKPKNVNSSPWAQRRRKPRTLSAASRT
ncbi:phage terminase large subunit [Mesorhizobium australicum]